jgi:hypothetical protein
MLLFGVGAAASSGNNNTTLGRIGLGYLYTDFKPQISWTLPGMGGFGAKIGLFDPDDVQADTAGLGATEGSSPRVEAQITYSGDVFNTGVGINLWVDGTYQSTDRTTAEKAAVDNFAANISNTDNAAFVANSATMATLQDDRDSVESAGVGFGTKLTYDAFSLVATGFYAHGLGIRGQRSVGPRHAVGGGAAVGSTGALDDSGKERKTYGGYIQGTFDFGQGTSVGYSYGGNYMKKNGRDMVALGVMNGQTMHSGMIWHNVTDNFRLVAEGGYTEKTWYLADQDVEDSFGGVGAFFFW